MAGRGWAADLPLLGVWRDMRDAKSGPQKPSQAGLVTAWEIRGLESQSYVIDLTRQCLLRLAT
jgi:hypothetical protein